MSKLVIAIVASTVVSLAAVPAVPPSPNGFDNIICKLFPALCPH